MLLKQFGMSYELLVWCLVGLFILWRFGSSWWASKKQLARGQKKRQIVLEHIKSVSKELETFKLTPEVETSVRKASIAELQNMLLSKKVTCVELVKYFTKLSVTQAWNLGYVVDVLYEDAVKLAAERDTQLKEFIKSGATNQSLPELFGIPVSIKDVIEYKGHDTSMGSSNYTFDPCPEHGGVVMLLLNAGGIPFVKTNCPQLLLINETNNWIWGRALNPWDTARTTGGSSGGEGGMVAMGFSPVGIGSDGGGSIRIPANYCGLYGVRATGKRFTMFGHKPPSSYIPRHIQGCVGPLARCMDDCIRVLKALQNDQLLSQIDPLIPPLPWKEEVQHQAEKTPRLKIGVIKRFTVSISNLRTSSTPRLV